jgi:hypothetical protein
VPHRGDITVEASIKGFYPVSASEITTPSTTLTQIHLVLRTETVHSDSDTLVARVWAAGPGFGAPKYPTFSLRATLDATGQQASVACDSGGSLSAARGTECFAAVSKSLGDWFSATGDVAVTLVAEANVGSTTVTSNSAALVLAKLPTDIDRDSEAGEFILALPSFPVIPGSSFTAPLSANTEEVSSPGDYYSLGGWIVGVTTATGVSFVSATSDLYKLECAAISTTFTRCAATVLSTVTDLTTVRGTNVGIADLVFKLSDSYSGGETTIANSHSVDVEQVVSTSNIEKSGCEGLVSSRTGVARAGALDAAVRTVVGVQAYVATSDELEFLNTAVLQASGDREAKSTISVRDIYSCHSNGGGACYESSESAASTTATCSPADWGSSDIVLETQADSARDECYVYVAASAKRGGDVAVTVGSSSSFSMDVRFRVWFPFLADLAASDTKLNRLLSPAEVASCAAAAGGAVDIKTNFTFQHAELRASAVLGLASTSGLSEADRVDVTPFSQIRLADEVADGDVVRVSEQTMGVFAVGLAASAQPVQLVLGQDLATLDLTVSDDTVELKTVMAAVLNTVEWVAEPAAKDLGDDFEGLSDAASASATASLELSAEGHSARVFAFVEFSDGKALFVAENLNLSTTRPDAVALSQGAGAFDSPPEVYVPVNAVSVAGQDVLTVAWTPGCPAISSSAASVTYSPYVAVELPDLTGLTLAISKAIIAPSDDLASDMGISTSSDFTITGSFADGSQRDFTSDDRATITFEPAGVLQRGTDNKIKVITGLGLTSSVDVKATVTFTGRSVQGTDTVTVDIFDSLKLAASASPSCTSSGCSPKTTIRRIQTAVGPFQRLGLALSAMSKKGTTVSLSLDSTVPVKISDSNVVIVSGGGTGNCATASSTSGTICTISDGSLKTLPLTGVRAGSATLTATWKTKATASVSLTVLDEATIVTAVDVTSPTSAVRLNSGSTTTMSVSTKFADGTTISSLSGVTWVKYSDYLVFSSGDTATLPVSGEGVLTAKLNTAGSNKVSITAASSLSSSIAETVSVTVNLIPSSYDVDLGEKTGSQFPEQGVGDVFEVDVIINSNTYYLTGFQLSINFDTAVITAVKVRMLQGCFTDGRSASGECRVWGWLTSGVGWDSLQCSRGGCLPAWRACSATVTLYGFFLFWHAWVLFRRMSPRSNYALALACDPIRVSRRTASLLAQTGASPWCTRTAARPPRCCCHRWRPLPPNLALTSTWPPSSSRPRAWGPARWLQRSSSCWGPCQAPTWTVYWQRTPRAWLPMAP